MARLVDVVNGRYRLLAQIGAGANGSVWRAVDSRLDLPVALKRLSAPRGTVDDEQFRRRRTEWVERARREVRAVQRLASHPGIVRIHDLLEDDTSDDLWIVMELVEAPTLRSLIDTEGRLGPAAVARIGRNALDALLVLHAAGVVHRDVKPANLLVRADGGVVLVDFGSATNPDDARLTRTGYVHGTPMYLAPERLVGEDSPGGDVFSLGACLFHALEGQVHLDVRGEGQEATVAAIVRQEFRTMTAVGPVASVVSRMLEADPRARLSATDARAALAALDGQETDPIRNLPRPRRPTLVAPAAPLPRVHGTWINARRAPVRPIARDRWRRSSYVAFSVALVLLIVQGAATLSPVLYLVATIAFGIGVVCVGTLIRHRLDEDFQRGLRDLVVDDTGIRTTLHVRWDNIRWLELHEDGTLEFAPFSRRDLPHLAPRDREKVTHEPQGEGKPPKRTVTVTRRPPPYITDIGMIGLCRLDDFRGAYPIDVIARIDEAGRLTDAPREPGLLRRWSGRAP